MSIAATILLTASISAVFLAENSRMSRPPMSKHAPEGLPLDSTPVQLSPNATVRYDPAKEVYIFSYERFDGLTAHMGFELATKVDAIIYGNVEPFPSDNPTGLRYTYALQNLPTSRQAVNWLAIITAHAVAAPSFPDPGWVVLIPPQPERITQGKQGVAWSDRKTRGGVPLPPLPVLTDEMAKAWAGVNRKKGPALPGIPHVRASHSGLGPGKRLQGFGFVSSRLPGIVPCLARGARFMPVTHGEPPPEVEELTFKNSFLFVEGKTVGPVLENPPQNPVRALNQLVAWVGEAEQLGWIKSDGLVREIISRLEKTRSYWSSGDWQRAAQELADIGALAESEKDVGIGSELFAILKFNSEALRTLALSQ